MKKTQKFDPQTHICKFGFKQYFDWSEEPIMNITCNLYEMELIVELIYKDKIDTIGFKLSNEKMNSLLPLIVWDDFEKERYMSESFDNITGYRDGWGYHFWCLNESGYPLIQKYYHCDYIEGYENAYSKLFNWLKNTFSKSKKFKGKKISW